MCVKILISIYFFAILCLFACSDELQCERHFIPHGYFGKVTIFFNQKNKERKLDKEGCRIYEIPGDGKYFTSFPYKEGSSIPNQTLRYFEIINKDSVKEIFQFEKNAFLQDTITNKNKKYVFFTASGYRNPGYFFEYYIDYGSNFRKY